MPVPSRPTPPLNPHNPLNPEEERVILHKGTERPYTGALLHNAAAGTYLCRQCGAELYRSDAKFDSGCGWPSFDDEIPGAVARHPDPDGQRVEITCAACGGHLGHVFEGEGFTPKNTRHCVNSVSLTFAPAAVEDNAGNVATPSCPGVAVFAGGCFWGVEDAFRKVPGVCDAVSGYTGGTMPDPTYEDVCTGDTGHAEAVRVSYDPAKVSYETLARLFFEIHDPTQWNRQGPDIGSQYRSAVFYADETQKAVAEKLVGELRRRGWEVVTRVEPLMTFYPAEEYHQDYAERTGRGGCHIRVPRFDRNAD